MAIKRELKIVTRPYLGCTLVRPNPIIPQNLRPLAIIDKKFKIYNEQTKNIINFSHDQLLLGLKLAPD
jgi:hypothetical protein